MKLDSFYVYKCSLRIQGNKKRAAVFTFPVILHRPITFDTGSMLRGGWWVSVACFLDCLRLPRTYVTCLLLEPEWAAKPSSWIIKAVSAD